MLLCLFFGERLRNWLLAKLGSGVVTCTRMSCLSALLQEQGEEADTFVAAATGYKVSLARANFTHLCREREKEDTLGATVAGYNIALKWLEACETDIRVAIRQSSGPDARFWAKLWLLLCTFAYRYVCIDSPTFASRHRCVNTLASIYGHVC